MIWKIIVIGFVLQVKACFSIDMKNSIDTSGDAPASNPRTYKTTQSGLVFEGEILLYKNEATGVQRKFTYKLIALSSLIVSPRSIAAFYEELADFSLQEIKDDTKCLKRQINQRESK